MAKRFTFIWILCGMLPALAQHSDSLQLQEASVTEYRLRSFSAGLLLEEIDSLTLERYQGSDMGTLLARETPIFIKSYGPGGLSTSSLRGGHASHTATIWNGFNLNSSMNSTMDLSLLPVGFMNEIIVQKGASTALWGSGALGGAVILNNQPGFAKGLRASVFKETGSFGLQGLSVNTGYSTGRYSGSMAFLHRSAHYDFPFAREFQEASDRARNSNAALQMHGLLTSQNFRVRKNQILKFNYWYQNTGREIAPTLFEAPDSIRHQTDISHRITADYSFIYSRQSFHIRAAYLDEYLLFTSSGLGDNYNQSQTLIQEAEWKYNLNDLHHFSLGLNYSSFWAQANEYSQDAIENRPALFALYRFFPTNRKWQNSLSIRQGWSRSGLLPLTFTLGNNYQVNYWLNAKLNISRVYRQPSLNDLYWSPGGNFDLKPEHGYSAEVTLDTKWDLKTSGLLQFALAGYYRKIQNWILWAPGPAYFSPQNLLQVESYGLETEAEYALQFGKVNFELKLQTLYVRSYDLRSGNPDHHQLIYTPLYSGHGQLSAAYRRFRLAYLQNYTGYTYTTTDNSEFLEPYAPASLRLEYRHNIRKLTVSIWGQANNIYNEAYVVMRNRPMPLLNFIAGIQINFN